MHLILSRLKGLVSYLIKSNNSNTHTLKDSEDYQDISLPEPSTSYENKMFNFKQSGLSIEGNYQQPLNVKCILVARVEEYILGMVTLPKLGDCSVNIKPLQTQFNMQLNPAVLSNNVDKNVTFTSYGKTVEELATIPCKNFILAAINQPFSIRKLAPSYGFFGGVNQEPLILPSNLTINSLTLSIPEPNCILNIKAVRLFDGQNKLIEIDNDIEFSFSSAKIPVTLDKNVLTADGFHSTFEDNPWLRIQFKAPREISRIEIINRTDQWSCRSQKIEINALDHEQKQHKLYQAFSEQAVTRFYGQAISILGSQCLSIENESFRREKVLGRVLSFLNINAKNIDSQVFQFLLQFLSTWGPNPSDNKFIETELEILAIYLVYHTKDANKFSLLPFSSLLSSKSHSALLENAVNKQRAKLGLDKVRLNKLEFLKQSNAA